MKDRSVRRSFPPPFVTHSPRPFGPRFPRSFAVHRVSSPHVPFTSYRLCRVFVPSSVLHSYPPFVSLPPLHLATLGSVPEETNGMSEERRETERKVEWRDEWKGTACDSSLKSLPVSVVHPQILGIACQLLPFVSSFVGLVTRPSCLTLLTPYERSRR